MSRGLNTTVKINKSDVSIDHMINDRAFEPQRSNHAYIQIDLSDLVGIYGEDLGLIAGSNNWKSSFATTMFRLALESFSSPSHSGAEIVIRKGNEAVKFTGAESYDNLDVVVDDFIGADMEYLVEAWDATRYNPVTGMTACAADYKRDGSIVEYSPDGKIVRTWKLLGCWVNGVKPDGFDRSSDNGTRKISFTLHIDKCYPELREKYTTVGVVES